MKKKRKLLSALLLSLLMVMAMIPATASAGNVATASTGARDTTGYENATLPTGPDMSGTVVTVTPENAQYTLDGAYGSIDGKTINFSSGSYTDTLVIGRATKFTNSNTTYYMASDPSTEVSYSDIVSNAGQSGQANIYERSVSDVTFTADEGVVLPGFYAFSGLAQNSGYNYVLEVDITGTGNNKYAYNGITNLSDITFDGLTISGSIIISNTYTTYYGSVSGITVEGCTFTGDEDTWETASGLSLIAIQLLSATGDSSTTYQDIEIKECTIQNYYFGIFTQNISGMTVANNSFTNMGYNAIQMSKKVLGVIDIEENLIKNTNDRAIKLVNAADATSVTVKNNVILNSGKNGYENFEADSLPSNTDAVSLDYNYWAGQDASTAISDDNSAYYPTCVGIIGGTFPESVSGYGYTGYVGIENADGTYTVVSADFTSNDTVITIDDGTYTYDGTAQKPSVTVTHYGYTLTEGTDYTVHYSDNTNAGTATVTVTGMGGYSGTVSATFTIEKATVYSTPTDLTATVGQTLADVELPDGWEWVDSSLSVGSAGTNTFSAVYTPDDTNNYNIVTVDLTVTVSEASANGGNSSGSNGSGTNGSGTSGASNNSSGTGESVQTDSSAQTGDDANLTLWIAIMLAAAAAGTGAAVYGRRRYSK